MRTLFGVLSFAVGAAVTFAGLDAARQAQELDMLRAAEAPPNATWIDSVKYVEHHTRVRA